MMNLICLFLALLPGHLPTHACTVSRDTVIYPENLHIVHSSGQYRAQVNMYPQHKLVALDQFIPGIHLDLRYAGTNNFMHRSVYTGAYAFMTLAAAARLKEVERELNKKGLGLLIYDAYRPYSATLKIFSIVRDTDYAASGKTGSRHNRACAVDLGLIELSSGKALEMPTGFDSFSLQAHRDYTGAGTTAIKNRALLREIMQDHGFSELKTEWWHFDFEQWRQFPLLDIPFESL